MRTSSRAMLALAVGGLIYLGCLGGPWCGAGAEELSVDADLDLNGDGVANLSDPILFLNWLFSGGPRPACPAFSELEDRIQKLEDEIAAYKDLRSLPATGQSVTFGDSAGQDGSYRAGCSSVGRFVDGGDGTVGDACTGLTWQAATADTNGDGSVDELDQLNWFDALDYCESLVFAGHDDWRLPNVRELQSLVDYGAHGPSIALPFTALPAWYWTSTSTVDDPGSAWYVDFGIGFVYRDNSKANRHLVRAVRGGISAQ